MATSKKRLYLSPSDRQYLIKALEGDLSPQALNLKKYFRRTLFEEGFSIEPTTQTSQEPEASFDDAKFHEFLGLPLNQAQEQESEDPSEGF